MFKLSLLVRRTPFQSVRSHILDLWSISSPIVRMTSWALGSYLDIEPESKRKNDFLGTLQRLLEGLLPRVLPPLSCLKFCLASLMAHNGLILSAFKMDIVRSFEDVEFCHHSEIGKTALVQYRSLYLIVCLLLSEGIIRFRSIWTVIQDQ